MDMKILELDKSRRNAILNSALKEFSSKGFDSASTNIIAKEAGISKALMFHYVNSKQDLFLFVYDYFTDVLDKDYYMKIDFEEADIFNRMNKNCLLQINLIKNHPWIFELNKLSRLTKSDSINKELEERKKNKNSSCYKDIFDDFDKTKFREGLDIEMSKQFIFWSSNGFTNEILNDIREKNAEDIDYNGISIKLTNYFDELKKLFYK